MKNMLGAGIVGILLAAPVVSGAGSDKSSKISAFAGKYRGTVLSAPSMATGTTVGRFSASAKKENGTLNLRSTLPGAGLLITERFAIRGKKFKYRFTVAGGASTVGSGSGKARVLRRAIKLTGSAIINGDQFLLNCTAKKAKRRLNVTSNVIGSGGLVLTYALKKKGK